MKYTISRLTVLAMLPVALTAGDRAEEILRQSDRYRPGFDSFVARVRLTNTESGRVADQAEFEVLIKNDNSLVRFLSPRSKGQSLLMRGDDMWMFLPAVARPVRITPIQRIMGNVSNGDLARLRYADDYVPSMAGVVTIAGDLCDLLELRAARKGATYQRIRYAVRQSDARPISAEYALTSGKVVKRAVFDGLREMAGRSILTRTVIEDADRPQLQTVIELISVVPKPLADKLFNAARADG